MAEPRLRFALIISALVIAFFASGLPGLLMPSELSGANYLAFRGLCHQKAERCLMLWGHPMPVCARCFGIYLGLALGALVFFGTSSASRGKWKWLLLSAVPMLLSAVLEWSGWYVGSNEIRLATGLLFGSMLSYFLFTLIND